MDLRQVHLAGAEAKGFLQSGGCELCMRPAREWAGSGKPLYYETTARFFVCPECATGTDRNSKGDKDDYDSGTGNH